MREGHEGKHSSSYHLHATITNLFLFLCKALIVCVRIQPYFASLHQIVHPQVHETLLPQWKDLVVHEYSESSPWFRCCLVWMWVQTAWDALPGMPFPAFVLPQVLILLGPHPSKCSPGTSGVSYKCPSSGSTPDILHQNLSFNKVHRCHCCGLNLRNIVLQSLS